MKNNLIFLLFFFLCTNNVFSIDLIVKEILNNKVDSTFLQKNFIGSVRPYKLRDIIIRLSEKHPTRYGVKFKDWYYGNFFFSKDHSLHSILKYKSTTQTVFRDYDKAGERPLQGYIAAANLINSFHILQLTVSKIKAIQKRIISEKYIPLYMYKKIKEMDTFPPGITPGPKASEKAQDHQKGKIRKFNVCYKTGGINYKYSNPYLVKLEDYIGEATLEPFIPSITNIDEFERYNKYVFIDSSMNFDKEGKLLVYFTVS